MTDVLYRSDSSRRFHSEPTVFENYVNELQVDDQIVELSLWDTAYVLLR
jgi:GTPase SAR1 family protein